MFVPSLFQLLLQAAPRAERASGRSSDGYNTLAREIDIYE